MMERSREFVLLIVLAALSAAGVVVGILSNGVEASRAAPSVASIYERASFCPPQISNGETKVSFAAVASAAVDVGIEPDVPVKIPVPAGRMLLQEQRSKSGSEVVGYGAPIAVSAFAQFSLDTGGAGAVRCSPAISARWFFGQGSSTVGNDERLLLSNPLPEEAVVRIVLFTPGGSISKANLADIAVPSGGSKIVRLNKFVLSQPTLAAGIQTVRGRVVAWKAALGTSRGNQPGADFTLAASAPEKTWYFPEGGVGTGLDESIGLLNPGRTTAKVTIELIGSKQIVQAPKLVSIPIHPHSAKTIRLAHFLHASNHSVGGVSAIVSTTGSSRIVAERSMTYTGAAAGRTSQVGAVAPSTTIAVGPATASPTTDNVVLLNPGAKPATVDITLLRSGHKPLTPKALQGIKVGAGGRIKVPVGRWTAGTPMEALIHSDRPVVGERLSYSSTAGDYSALMGMPLVTPNVP